MKDGPQWRSFTNTHCVTLLLNEVDRLVSGNQPAFASKDADHWSIPDEIRILIQVIEKYDKSSTFSRYGDSGNPADEFKADFVRVDPAKLNVPDVSSSGGLTYILLNDENVAAEAFQLQTAPLPEFRLALVKAAEMLSSASFGLDADLVGGWSTLAKEFGSNPATVT